MNISEIVEALVASGDYEKGEGVSSKPDGATFANAVKAYFSEFRGREFAESNWSLPEDYAQFLELGVRLTQGDEELDEVIYAIDEVLRATTEPWYEPDMDDFKKRADAGRLYQSDTLWLNIGWWGDKHECFICCDKMHENFGKVFDCHDGTPWSHDDDGYIDSYASFTEFMNEKIDDDDDPYYQ